MGHLAHNWCSSSVKCRRNINRLQNTRLLCSTNSESDSCLWFWRFFSYALNPLSAFSMFGENVMLQLIVSEMTMLRYIYAFYSLSWLCLLLTVLSGNVTQFWVELEVGCLYHALELQSFAASVAPWKQRSADAALAARNHTCRKALRLERGCGTLSQLRQYRQARWPRTILEHWRNDLCCAVTDFWCSKYCYRHNLFNCVGSHHWKTVKLKNYFLRMNCRIVGLNPLCPRTPFTARSFLTPQPRPPISGW